MKMTCTGTLSKTQGWGEVELCFDSNSLSFKHCISLPPALYPSIGYMVLLAEPKSKTCLDGLCFCPGQEVCTFTHFAKMTPKGLH